MTRFNSKFAFAAALATIAAATLLPGSAAEAGGRGREVFVQDYTFDKPTHGYSGHAGGGYYCDYQRLPNRKCTVDKSGNESCRIVSWTLREMCQ